jgi:hypothetical protein
MHLNLDLEHGINTRLICTARNNVKLIVMLFLDFWDSPSLFWGEMVTETKNFMLGK